MITWEIEEDIGILRLARPPMNALELDLLQQLEEALGEAERSPARAVILTGEGPAFSAGADLFEVLEQGSNYIERGRPIVVVLLRPAVPISPAGGGRGERPRHRRWMHHAQRVRPSGGRRGRLSHRGHRARRRRALPHVALEIMRFAVLGGTLQELVMLGRAYPPGRALEKGLLRPDRSSR